MILFQRLINDLNLCILILMTVGAVNESQIIRSDLLMLLPQLFITLVLAHYSSMTASLLLKITRNRCCRENSMFKESKRLRCMATLTVLFSVASNGTTPPVCTPQEGNCTSNSYNATGVGDVQPAW